MTNSKLEEYDEKHERLDRCVVCCADLTHEHPEDDEFPNYCGVHVLTGDPSIPPIPMKEWWPKQYGYMNDRFTTGGNYIERDG